MTKDKFIDLTTILELKKKVEQLQAKASQWDAYQYWSSPGNYGHGAG